MEIKIQSLVLLSLLLLIINIVCVNGHQVSSSHDLAHDHGKRFGFYATPRKLMLNPKVGSVEDKDLVSYNDDLSGESYNREGEEVATTTSLSKVTIQKESRRNRVFTMDYSPVRRRRPVHNKSLPTKTTSP